MNLQERIDLLSAVGTAIKSDLDNNRLEELYFKAENENPWFIQRFVKQALKNIVSNYLNKDALIKWVGNYEMNKGNKTIGLVAAGNIPLVGLHDLISVFVSGNKSKLKLSSKDSALMKYFINTMSEIESTSAKYFEFVEQLKNFDAVIATGSDNTNRYFEYYFGKYPNLLRKNRTSVAVIKKDISDTDLLNLVHDIFSYFGLGCRSVSKVYIEHGFDLIRLLKASESYDWLNNHYKFQNNYTYQKSIYLVNKVSHFDTGFSILREEKNLHSPISVVFYEIYHDFEQIFDEINRISEQVQIVVSDKKGSAQMPVIQYGNAQETTLLDYADAKDTLSFLTTLN